MKFFKEMNHDSLDDIDHTVPYSPVENELQKLGVRLIKSETDFYVADRGELPDFFIDPRVCVKDAGEMGLGCFATDHIPAKTLIESATGVLISRELLGELDELLNIRNVISDYTFTWRDGLVIFAQGFAGLYNHDPYPNAQWRPNFDIGSMEFRTTKDIQAGEQIFIRYLPISSLDKLWFACDKSTKAFEMHGENPSEIISVPKTWGILND